MLYLELPVTLLRQIFSGTSSVLGGSATFRATSRHSDFDVYTVADKPIHLPANLAPFIDLETVTTDEFNNWISFIERFVPSYYGRCRYMSPNNLRFLLRFAKGVQICADGGAFERLKAAGEKLHVYALAHISRLCLSRVEDVVGFCTVRRWDDAALVAPIAFQTALQLAVMQVEQIDPSEKHALFLFERNFGFSPMLEYDRINGLTDITDNWLTEFLGLLNRVIITGMTKRIGRVAMSLVPRSVLPAKQHVLVTGAPNVWHLYDFEAQNFYILDRDRILATCVGWDRNDY